MRKSLRVIILVTGDIFCSVAAILLSFYLTVNNTFAAQEQLAWQAAILLIPAGITVAMNAVFKLYKRLWEFAGINELLNAVLLQPPPAF